MNNEDKLAIFQKNAQESFKHSSRLDGLQTNAFAIPLEERIKVIAKAWVFYGGDYNSFWKSRDEILMNIYHVLYKEE